MCGLCSLVKRSQRLKKSDLSVFDTRHLSDRVTQQRSPLPASKFQYLVDESSLPDFGSSQAGSEQNRFS
jgi:hypothetical protein